MHNGYVITNTAKYTPLSSKYPYLRRNRRRRIRRRCQDGKPFFNTAFECCM